MSYIDEVLRVHDRYVREVVEAFNLCPFAHGARKGGAVESRVVLDVAEAEATVAAIAGRETIDIGLVLFPLLKVTPEEFEKRVEPLRKHERRFVMATFHPDAVFSDASPQQLIPLFRRSPYPTIQMVRMSSLESVRSRAPGGKFLFDFRVQAYQELERRVRTVPLSEQIARDNQATVNRVGSAAILAVLEDIYRDRDQVRSPK